VFSLSSPDKSGEEKYLYACIGWSWNPAPNSDGPFGTKLFVKMFFQYKSDKMNDLKFFGPFVLFFGLIFIVSLITGFLYQLIAKGSGVFDPGSSLTFALVFTLIFSFVKLFNPGTKAH